MERLNYVSTRGHGEKVTASQAILRGIAPDGGLYAPERVPSADFTVEELFKMPYNELAYRVLRLFLTDYSEGEIRAAVTAAYDEKFDTPVIAPLVSAGGAYFLELFHGPTLAFKDMALSILPRLMKTAAAKNGLDKRIIILVSTSGDTGKAALEGFSGVEGTAVLVFYPKGRVSRVQELQMTTTTGDNVGVLGINGNFDDCQTTMKGILTDPGVARALCENGAVFSSANSINAGRLLPQIVYYFYAYGQMAARGALACGQPLNFTVPTGNFGNILAGWYAKQMGLPVGTLICASNENNVLYDFFKTGAYDKNRPLVETASPSMDILVSSNLERLLYHLSGDPAKVGGMMESLTQSGVFSFSGGTDCFYGAYASGEEASRAIGRVYKDGYVMDTHTAVAYAAYEKYAASGDGTPNVILSTASPFKFPRDVLAGIDGGAATTGGGLDDIALLSGRTGLITPESLRTLGEKAVLHNDCRDKEQAAEYVVDFIKKFHYAD